MDLAFLFPEPFLELIILLVVGPDRRHLRGTCKTVDVAGGTLLRLLRVPGVNQTFQQHWSRLYFWSPWVGHRVIRREHSFAPAHWEAVWSSVGACDKSTLFTGRDSFFRMHGASSLHILHRTHDDNDWVDTIVLWRRRRFERVGLDACWLAG